MTSDREFAEYLRSLPREKSPEEAEAAIREHDSEYVAHRIVHHTYGESRQS